MTDNNYAEFDDILEENENPAQERKVRKTKKRKWREIETIKEKQRLRREFIEYNE